MPFERIKSLLASFLPSTIPLSLASPSPNAPDDALGGGGLTPDQHAESVIGQISEVLKNQQLSLEELNNIWELACSVDAGASFRLRFIMSCLQSKQDVQGLRQSFFKIIRAADLNADFVFCLDVLKELTKDGRQIRDLDKDIGLLLNEWLDYIVLIIPSTTISASSAITGAGEGEEENESEKIANLHRGWLASAIPFFSFLTNIVKFNFVNLEETSCQKLLSSTTEMCEALTLPLHTELAMSSLQFFDAFIRYGSLPTSCIHSVILTLCRFLNVDECSLLCWQCATNLISSPRMFTTVKTLCDVLDNHEHHHHPNHHYPRSNSTSSIIPISDTICSGSLRFLWTVKWGERRLENLAFPSTLILSRFVNHIPNAGPLTLNQLLVFLEAMASEIDSSSSQVSSVEWEMLVEIANKLFIEKIRNLNKDPVSSSLSATITTTASFHQELPTRFLNLVIKIKDKFFSSGQKESFYSIINECATDMRGSYVNEWIDQSFECMWQYSFPDWIVSISRLMAIFFSAPSKESDIIKRNSPSSSVSSAPPPPPPPSAAASPAPPSSSSNSDTVYMDARLRIIGHIRQTFSIVSDIQKHEIVIKMFLPMLRYSFVERNEVVLKALFSLVIDTIPDCNEQQIFVLVDAITRNIKDGIPMESALAIATSTTMSSSLTETSKISLPNPGLILATDALICVMQSCNKRLTSWNGFLRSYDSLLELLGSRETDLHIRLRVASYFLSLRSNLNNFVDLLSSCFMSPPISFLVDGRSVISKFDSTNSPTTTSSNNITSYYSHQALSLTKYFDCLLDLLAHEQEWSLFWFVIKRIPYQLENMIIFSDCCNQIQRLRNWCCDVVNTESVCSSVTEIPTTVKKTEIYDAVCRLAMILIQYRSFFSKQQQDELILTFHVGFQKWPRVSTAKLCLQALTLALFEMPESISRLLPSILMKVSQTTTSAMGVWNVEFLSTLGRLPSLFKNFTDADFKRVFGVALQYIQYTDVSGMLSSESASTSLVADPLKKGHAAVSQYVVNMAYYVLGIWFKNVKLAERKKYVPFIIHFLLQNRPVTASSPPDEDVEMVLDILAVNCFADCLPKPTTDVYQQQKHDKQQLPSKMWLIGNSLMSIRLLPHLSHERQGWVEILIRRPSGVIQLKSRLENRLRLNLDLDASLGISLPAQVSLNMINDDNNTNNINSLGDGSSSSSTGGLLKSNSLVRRASLSSASRSMSRELIAPSEGLAGVGDGSDQVGAERRGSRRSRAASFGIVLSGDPSADWNNVAKMKSLSSVTSSSSLNSSISSSLSSSSSSSSISVGGDSRLKLLSERGSSDSDNFKSSIFLSALDPSFHMLQMMTFPDWTPNAATPCLINEDDGIKRAIKVLDHIPVVDLHKIGVVYVGETQQEQNEILSNISGSRSYHHFLQNLGELVRLRDCKDVYTGGLDTMNDIDGKVALWWGDHDSSQMIFHVTTMMPNNDKERTGKKRHIGNNYVLVVWNESGLDKDSGNGGWKFDTIPAQFNFINIIISPIGSVQMLADSGGSSNNTGSITASSYYKVYVQRRPDIPDTIGGGAWSGVGLNLDDRPRILSESALPSFIRQLCIHANIFAQVFQAAQSSTGFSSNAKERLRQMKRIRTRASSTISTAAAAPTGGSNNNNNSAIDFSRYS